MRTRKEPPQNPEGIILGVCVALMIVPLDSLCSTLESHTASTVFGKVVVVVNTLIILQLLARFLVGNITYIRSVYGGVNSWGKRCVFDLVLFLLHSLTLSFLAMNVGSLRTFQLALIAFSLTDVWFCFYEKRVLPPAVGVFLLSQKWRRQGVRPTKAQLEEVTAEFPPRKWTWNNVLQAAELSVLFALEGLLGTQDNVPALVLLISICLFNCYFDVNRPWRF